ncbi:MAG: hypothetical protein NTU97_00580 [Candidatus Magasanikbacteria bacterium]|nr:hypothetical protein [Candidatus Magasanikbacteria bacterium]
MKIFYAVATIIFIVIMVSVFKQWQNEKETNFKQQNKLSYCSDEIGKQIDCRTSQKYGKVFMHSFGSTCEIKAKDANKECTYNDECDKGCVYTDQKATVGKCDSYWGDNDGVTTCTRKRGTNIQCSLDIS